ncbi:LVIVD repeat-containing protein [Mangrovibacterium lignilyticum]|uniref:hypothetical protein n=1 Tax=Mangrovibacterium lignilyticum TaxID=2668052 RepID=UPI0013CF4A47|nr:hypothetical protein [Mangrovibacterium lignilyticum]
MRQTRFYVLVLIGMIMFACDSENSNSDSQSDQKIILQLQNLDSRVHTDNAGVVEKQGMPAMPENFFSTESYISKSATIDSEVASDLPLMLIAEVDAPEYDGLVLQATHVCFNGNYAYVSYNVKGASYLGAVDAIDISDPTMPQLAMHAVFPSMDISSLTIKDGVLYMAGARDVDAYENVTNPAVLVKMTLDGDMLSDDILFIELSSYVGTDVVAGENDYYCVSGNTGALSTFTFSEDLLTSSINTDDLRAVGIDGDKLVTLSGTQGVHVYTLSTMAEATSFTVSSDVAEAKRTIDFYDNHVLVSEGYDGLGVYSLADGSQKISIPVASITDPEIIAEEVVCNAVTVNDEHIFMAEGAAGVVVYSLVANGLDNPVEIGGLSLEGSANYVKSGDDYIFVADGTGGLKILKVLSCADDEGDTGEETPTYTCSSYPAYTGNSWLNVNSNDDQAYSGSASLGGMNISAQLIWCGSLAVSQHVNVNSQGEFVIIGSLATGQKKNGNASSGTSLIVNQKMIVDGSLVVYGDLIVNSGGSLEFVGSSSSIAVYGDVTINNSGEIIGDYTDETGNVKL